MRILLAALVLTTALPAQTHTAKPKEARLRFTLILSRHGIRPPLVDASSINVYAAQPWPDWEVPPGHLTPHGADALRQMGAYMRLDFARTGLFPLTGCPTSSDIYLYADTDERNISSTRASFSAFAPGCAPLPIHSIDPKISIDSKIKDPIFRPTEGTFTVPRSDTTAERRAALLAETPNVLSPESHAQLELMAHVLAPDPAHPAEKSIFGSSDKPPAPTDDILAADRPRATASNLVEDLELEYIDNKPLSEVGWGRVDEATLRQLMPIHIGAFSSVRILSSSRPAASNILSHIIDTLDQASTGALTPGALGPAGARLVYISGHDSTLVALAGVLGIHWDIDNRIDDTPPDSQMIFELWQRPGTHQLDIRMHYRGQTFKQLRNASPLSLADPPSDSVITPTGCEASRPCTFDTFRKAALSKIDPAYVKHDLFPTHVQP